MPLSLIELIATPLMLLLCIWLCRKTQIMTKLAALLFWVQVLIVTYVLSPALLGHSPALSISADFTIDRIGALFVVLTQIVVASSMTHAHLYFQQDGAHAPEKQNSLRGFYTCATLLLVAMTGVFFCNSLGFLWVSVEGTTLCSAPLVFYHRNKHALEAAWKYLMICSVGIAFALFGTMFIFASSQHGAVSGGSLNLLDLQSNAPLLQYPLLRLGFLFCLLGYGTKAGVFPLHSWLPDAYAEAPAPASAMLAGGLGNCALFAIWRISQVVNASGHESLTRNAAISAGVLTVLVASIFLIRQHSIKRLFAYSSIENVGLMLTAIGLGSGPLFFLLALNLSATKVALFLVSGNIIQVTGTKSINDIRGLMAINPYWSGLLLLGAFAVTGAPPFGAFAAELILLAAVTQLHMWTVLAVLLVALAVSFLSVIMHVGCMLCGTPKDHAISLPSVGSSIIPAALILITLLCGVTALPKFLW